MLIDNLTSRGFVVKKKTAKESCSPCPFCGGVDRFAIFLEENRYWCRQCGKRGDEIQLIMDLDGLTFPEAKAKLGQPLNAKPTTPTKKPQTPTGKLAAKYIYRDKLGAPVFEVHRIEYPEGGKEFKQIPYVGGSPKNVGMKGVQLVLYNLPEVLENDIIWMTEGEKTAAEIKHLNLAGASTCNPGGALKVPRQHEDHGILSPLASKTVYILPDNDDPGRTHAQQIAEILHGKAKIVKILELPGLPPKGDIVDYAREHGDYETIKKLNSLVESTESWKPHSNFFQAEDLLKVTFNHNTPIISNGIIPYNSHIIISGESGVGKSLFRQELTLHLIMGWDFLGFNIPTSRKVAVFQYENSESIEQFRMKKMCDGLGITSLPKGRLSYIDRKNRINLSLKKDREKLLGYVKESGAEVIIYDCLSNIHSAKENDNIQMREILDSLTEVNAILNTTCIVIHHFGKPSEGQQGNTYRTRGASSIMDWAVTAMAYTSKPNEHKILRQLEFLKVRDGPVPKPLLLERGQDFLLSIIDEGTLCSPVKVKEILMRLGGEVDCQSKFVKAIQEEAGCSPRSARSFIYRAIQMKEILEMDNGQGKAKKYVTFD